MPHRIQAIHVYPGSVDFMKPVSDYVPDIPLSI